MRIDHIGYAVKKIYKAISAFEKLGFHFGDVIEDFDRNIKISFGHKDGYRIELVQSLDKKIQSPVDTYLNKVGSTPYHICYVSDTFDSDIKDLKSKGFRVILDPMEAVAFHGKRVVFLMNLDIGLLEIVEE